MIRIEIDGGLPDGIEPESIRAMAERVLGGETPGISYILSLNVTDSEEMRKINRLYRGNDETTDVLSFVLDELILDGAKTRICDIVVDINAIAKQKGKNSISEEFWQVLIHGLLHLADHDHNTLADRNKMEDAEENYRSQLMEVWQSGR